MRRGGRGVSILGSVEVISCCLAWRSFGTPLLGSRYVKRNDAWGVYKGSLKEDSLCSLGACDAQLPLGGCFG